MSTISAPGTTPARSAPVLGRWLRRLAIGLLGCAGAAGASAQGQPAAGSPYHVGVWHFTLWNSATRGFQVQQALKNYHRPDVWAGVRDYAQGHGLVPVFDPRSGAPVSYAGREPLIGFYDEMQPRVVDAEITEAARAGIDFFAFYWYLDTTGREPICPRRCARSSPRRSGTG